MEVWDLIDIYGGERGPTEIYRGIGTGSDYATAASPTPDNEPTGTESGEGDTPGEGTTESTPEDTTEIFPETLWTAQNDVLTQQSKFLDDIAELYAAKQSDIPQSPIDGLLDTLIEELVAWGVAPLVTWLVGMTSANPVLAPFAGEAASFLVGLGFSAWDTLKAAYSAGVKLCSALAAENEQLKKLSRSRENYLLRSTLIVQHEQSIDNILGMVDHAETQAQQWGGATSSTMELDVSSLTEAIEDLKTENVPPEDLLQAIRDLRYNNIVVQGRDGKKLLLSNGVIAEDS